MQQDILIQGFLLALHIVLVVELQTLGSAHDLYVFVVDLKDDRFRAHGIFHDLIGSDALALHDPSGRPIVQDMIAALAKGDQAEVDYSWPNPVTGGVENKHTYLRKIGDLLVGVGYYWR